MVARAALFLGLVFAPTMAGCPAGVPEPPRPPAKATEAAPATAPPAVVEAEVVGGRKIGPLIVGALPPDGPDGRRTRSDGLRSLYWSDLGLLASVGKDGLVVGAGAGSPAADPFFRRHFQGRTAQGIGIGDPGADALAKLGPCEAKPAPSHFVSDRVILTCNASGLSLSLAKPGGEVIAMWVGAETP